SAVLPLFPTRRSSDLRVRATPPGPLSAESFLRRYGLSTREGVALMCVAEALLRIPDPQTADALLRDKLSSGNWSLTKDDASFVRSEEHTSELQSRGHL